jgi:hypothetical protein
MFAQKVQKELGTRDRDLKESVEKERLELDKKRLREDIKKNKQPVKTETNQEDNLEEVAQEPVKPAQPIKKTTSKSPKQNK